MRLTALAACAVVALATASRAAAVEATDARSGDVNAPRFRIEERVRVREKQRADAEVCLVHLHGNEVNAREVMLELGDTSCANVLWLDDARTRTPWGDDRIPVPNATMAARVCSVNPNRILTPAGFAVRIDNDCEGDETARRELRRFLDQTFLPALARCRGRGLPVVAFHNHSRLTNGDMDASVSSAVAGAEHDILFVTRRDDYDRLVGLARFSVALQNAPPADDGSLSVALQRDRYVNVEAQIAPRNKRVNRAMGEWALRSVGGFVCGPADWPAPKRPRR